jgi:hypothetical protein
VAAFALISSSGEGIEVLGGVFISYRREDTGGIAGRIYDRLVNRLGHDNVFFDVDTIPPGRDFVDVLSDRVGKCNALVAVIGKRWVASVDEANRRRLDDPSDFVRIEIEAALQRDVPVIPVLVDGAAMPQAVDLPDVLKKLARRQGIEISHNRFDSDADRLTKALSAVVGDDGAVPSVGTRVVAPASPSGSAKIAADAGAIEQAAMIAIGRRRWAQIAFVAAVVAVLAGFGATLAYFVSPHVPNPASVPTGSGVALNPVAKNTFESRMLISQIQGVQKALCASPDGFLGVMTRQAIVDFFKGFDEGTNIDRSYILTTGLDAADMQPLETVQKFVPQNRSCDPTAPFSSPRDLGRAMRR